MRLFVLALGWATAAGAIAAPPTEPYIAIGSGEPWTLTISDEAIRFERPGHATLSELAPAAERDEMGRRFATERMDVRIMSYPCRNRTSGRRHVDSVVVTVEGREHQGCGGEIIPADSLDYTSWLFVEIDGQPTELTGDLLRDDRYAIDFGPDSFVGYGGCNRFTAGYSRSGNVLTATLIGRTRRACAEPTMLLESRLLGILSQPVRISFPDGDTLVLTREDATVRLRRTDGNE